MPFEESNKPEIPSNVIYNPMLDFLIVWRNDISSQRKERIFNIAKNRLNAFVDQLISLREKELIPLEYENKKTALEEEQKFQSEIIEDTIKYSAERLRKFIQ